MLNIGDALTRVMTGAAPLGSERVPLEVAHERRLATGLLARMDSPPFANSAMDGYALRSSDLTAAAPDAPVWLPVVGESSAGITSVPECAPGGAVRIFTGAPLPLGADCVVIQENVTREGQRAAFRAPAATGQNVRQQGEDVAVGQPLLAAGARLRAGELGLLASQGIGVVDVVRRPRVGILSSGDELRRLDEPERPGSIVNSNAYMLEALVRDAGGIPDVRPLAADRLDALTESVEAALEANDVVLSTGGVSVGDHDLMRDAFVAAGVEMGFWKVAIKPGKPLAFGRRPDGRAVIGLPGNPVSAFVTYEVLVRPLLQVLGGHKAPYRAHLRATLQTTVKRTRDRDELLRGQLVADPSSPSAFACVPVARRGSGALPSLAGVDVLLLVPMGDGELAAGSTIDCLPLFDAPTVAQSPFVAAIQAPGKI